MRDGNTILHVFGWDRKFVPAFISFVRDRFPGARHEFLIHGPADAGELRALGAVTHYENLLKNIPAVSRQLRSAGRIILHGLFSSHLYYVLALHPWLLKRCYWMIWGGDLYVHQQQARDWRWRKDEWFRRFVISRLGHLVTHVEGDVDLARSWYGARGAYHECLMYLSNVCRVGGPMAGTGQAVHILMGNSADPSNNHLEIIRGLAPFRDQDIIVFAPLSYGDRNHAKKVMNEGRAVFGGKFRPMTEFLSPDAYRDFLRSIDIAVFNHRRQQAMGNVIALLGMGKTVYMRPEVSSAAALKKMGLKIKDVNALTLEKISDDDARLNSEIVAERFSEERLLSQLAAIFGAR